RWWGMTEACSGHSGELSAVRWYRVPGWTVPVNGEAAAAFWTTGGNQIVIADELVEDGEVVRHEMLHALLGERGHPTEPFLTSCASVLSCGRVCEPWHAPRPDYVVLPPDFLDVSSH